jgi:hypothetical protein
MIIHPPMLSGIASIDHHIVVRDAERFGHVYAEVRSRRRRRRSSLPGRQLDAR